MSSVHTLKGTELPLVNLKGKQYLQVAHRVLWFREERPSWSIETQFLKIADDYAIAHAQVKDDAGRVIATGTKQETMKGFQDFVEKAETGAIGRALALCGYGTQFAQELDEEERLADSPQPPKQNATQLEVYPADVNAFVAECKQHNVTIETIQMTLTKETGKKNTKQLTQQEWEKVKNAVRTGFFDVK